MLPYIPLHNKHTSKQTHKSIKVDRCLNIFVRYSEHPALKKKRHSLFHIFVTNYFFFENHILINKWEFRILSVVFNLFRLKQIS